MQDKTLGDIVHEALEDYNPSEGRFSKLKSSLETFVAKHRWKIVGVSTITMAGIGYLYSSYLGGIAKQLIEVTNPAAPFQSQIQIFRSFGTGVGAGVGYLVSILTIPYLIGKSFYSKIKLPEKEKNKKKIGKIFRHPKLLGLAGTALWNYKTILGTPERINELIETSKLMGTSLAADRKYAFLFNGEIFNGLTFLIQFATLSALFYISRDLENMGKKGFKNLGEFYRSIPTHLVGLFSKEKKIELLRKASQKRDSIYLKWAMRSAILKKDINEGLAYCKSWIDETAAGNEGLDFASLKKFDWGNGIGNLFKKKEDWLSFLELSLEIYKENPEAAKKVIKKIREAMPEERMDVEVLLNTFCEEIFKEPQYANWKRIAQKMPRLAQQGIVEEFQGTEGRTWAYKGSEIINATLLAKERSPDYFERFLKQRFEYEILLKHGLKTEKPLAFIEEEQKALILVSRVGKTTLRDALKDKDKSYKRKAFEKVIEQGILAQKMLYDNIREENGNFFMNVSFENKDYSLKVDVLDLERQLLSRAFIGDDKRHDRFGWNEYLEPLLRVINAYQQENYSPIKMTINHGDYFTTNITENYARFDSRHVVADTLFDLTHISLDPVFIELAKEEREEINFRKLDCIYQTFKEENFRKSFDVSYLYHGLGLAASHKSRREMADSAKILHEILEFSKGKPFEKELLAYLKNSSAKEIMKII
jgi:hypothetical protein